MSRTNSTGARTAALAGASFAGADWTSRSMSNQVLFEPRRGRLWLAKAVAVTLMCAIATLLVVGLTWLGWYAVANARDISVTDGFVGTVGWHVLRAVVLGGLAGLCGYALTMWFRSTVATLGVVFGTTIALVASL